MHKQILALGITITVAGCGAPEQLQPNTSSPPESAVATLLTDADFNAALIPNQPRASLGQVLGIELIRTLGTAIRGGIALAIDQKFNQNSNGPFDPYPYPSD